MDDPTTRLRLLEGFALTVCGSTVRLPIGAQRMLAFLALHPDASRRAVIADALWPDSTPEHAAASLRTVLWRLRHAGITVADVVDGRVLLRADVAVDVRELERAVARLRDPRIVCRDDELSADWLRGELLPDWPLDEWATVERERLRQVRLHGLEALADRLLALGRYGEAVEIGLTAVRDEPLRESAHRAVVRAHLAEGNRGEAVRQYVWYAQLLARELHAVPTQAFDQLVAGLPLRAPRRSGVDRSTAINDDPPQDARR